MFTGFLESGKTHFVREILSDENFTQNEKTLLIACEEGEEEYDEIFLKKFHAKLVTCEECPTPQQCADWQQQYHPDRVLIEWNGMWPCAAIEEMLPPDWALYQSCLAINAETFELYINNMGQRMLDQIMYADLIVFNRCTEETKAFIRSKNIRAMSPRATIFLEDSEGNSEDYADGMPPPFDLDAPVIEIADEDFGLWYVDAMNDSAKYEGKTVRIKGMAFHGKEMAPDEFVPGRFAMVCCADDITFIGFVCRSKQACEIENETWVTVTATVHVEEYPQYRGEGPVLYAETIALAEKPQEEVVQFN